MHSCIWNIVIHQGQNSSLSVTNSFPILVGLSKNPTSSSFTILPKNKNYSIQNVQIITFLWTEFKTDVIIHHPPPRKERNPGMSSNHKDTVDHRSTGKKWRCPQDTSCKRFERTKLTIGLLVKISVVPTGPCYVFWYS